MDKIAALRRKLIKSTKEKVKEHYSGKDVHLIKSINLMDDLDSVFNLLAEQLIEWYGVHFPELNSVAKDNEQYLKLAYELGGRKEFTEKKVAEWVKGKDDLKRIVEAAKKSNGAAVEDSDLGEIKLLALNALNLKEERTYLGKYIEKGMNKALPNFTALAGPFIGARLLAKAGSSKKLAFMPASTIQVLGAEKALFLHLKKGSKGPKYGFLYSHPLVKQVKPWNRGKVARSLAAKLSIAVKGDYFGKKNISDGLKKDLEKRLKDIEKNNGPKKSGKPDKRPDRKFKPGQDMKFKPRPNNKFRNKPKKR